MHRKIQINETKTSKQSLSNSKIRSLFTPIYLLHTLFGNNLLQKTGCLGVFINIYCIFIATVSSCYLLFEASGEIWMYHFIFLAVEYIGSALNTCFGIVPSTSDYFVPLESVDSKLGFGLKEFDKLRKFHNLIACSIFIRRIIGGLGGCFVASFNIYDVNVVLHVLIQYIIIAVDLLQIPRLLFFSVHYLRIKLLRENIVMSGRKEGRNCVDGGPAIMQPDEHFLLIFSEILDSIDNASKQINPMYMLSLVCSFPKIMCVIYTVLWSFENNSVPLFHLVLIGFEIVQWGIMPVLPAIVVEMIQSEIEKIKIFYLNSLIDCRCERRREQLERFLRYVALRPFSYSVWRLLRVDGALPAALLALLTTHLIVLIQFTHLYG